MKINIKKYFILTVRRLDEFYDEQTDVVNAQFIIAVALLILYGLLYFMCHLDTITIFGSILKSLWLTIKLLSLSLSIHYSGWEAYNGVCHLVQWARNQKL